MSELRFQLRRTKGWRMPENGVSVARPSRFSNPFTIRDALQFKFASTESEARVLVVAAFAEWLEDGRAIVWGDPAAGDARRSRLMRDLPLLRGKHLGCYCPLDAMCHANVLLVAANP